jgi:hypothetical protein
VLNGPPASWPQGIEWVSLPSCSCGAELGHPPFYGFFRDADDHAVCPLCLAWELAHERAVFEDREAAVEEYRTLRSLPGR